MSYTIVDKVVYKQLPGLRQALKRRFKFVLNEKNRTLSALVRLVRFFKSSNFAAER